MDVSRNPEGSSGWRGKIKSAARSVYRAVTPDQRVDVADINPQTVAEIIAGSFKKPMPVDRDKWTTPFGVSSMIRDLRYDSTDDPLDFIDGQQERDIRDVYPVEFTKT